MVVPDEKIIAAMFACTTNREAAAYAGLSESQFYARLKTVEMQEVIRALNTDMLITTAMDLRKKVQTALDVSAEILEDQEQAPQVRLNAASLILSHAGRIGALAWKADNREPEEDQSLKRLDRLLDIMRREAREVKSNE